MKWREQGSQVSIKSRHAYVVLALLLALHLPNGIRGKIANEIRGQLKAFGMLFGQKLGGLPRQGNRIR
ncbi:hypothetical protein NKI09_20610 [Mesorhizobium sp. M0757]|uniref:hypothetical protein n=1 Tax=unclassified Mesorhizobium TaxID=325217 RepID=UPI0033379A92